MEILDTIEVWNINRWIIALTASLFGAFVGFLYKFTIDRKPSSFIISICIFISLLILACFGKFSYLGYKKLVVKIDESTTVAELYSKYDIIGKQDYSNIFYVKEKDNSK